MDLTKEALFEKGWFRSKEASWLSFNERVLQEAADPETPLIERIRFLGIYSSNMDEFFRVRVATLKRLSRLGKYFRKLGIPDPKKTLKEVSKIAHQQAIDFNVAYADVKKGLEANGIQLIDEKSVPPDLEGFLEDYFLSTVKPRIMPIMIKANSLLVGLKDHPMYLAVRLTKKGSRGRPAHALLEIPSDQLPRFVTLPSRKGIHRVMYLDDIIRFGVKTLFSSLAYDTFESYAIKFTRDSEMEFDDDITESIYEKVSEGLREREKGNPVRLNYDAEIPQSMLRLLLKKLNITGEDTLFPGARYHNRKDLLGFPAFGRDDLTAERPPPLPHRILHREKKSLFKRLRTRDHLLHFPYHTFNTFLDLLREASMDPLVDRIFLTQYRLAKRSCVANALIAAAKNGKEITVLVEPRARFDEGRNISYANAFQEAGIKVILGVPGLKVHAKLCLIVRREGGKRRYYSCIGTGNFNEDTAGIYTDHMLLTSNEEIGRDIARSFKFFQNSYQPPKLRHLVAAPFQLRNTLANLIQKEIDEAKEGRKAWITIKLNNLSDPDVVAQLYRASRAGVEIRLIVRSMFSLIPGKANLSENIEAIGIVDKYLEHSRIFAFGNGGKPKYYLSSADFLPRNFDSRFEVVCPVFDTKLQAELEKVLKLQWADNVKARFLDAKLSNRPHRHAGDDPPVRSQIAVRDYLESLLKK